MSKISIYEVVPVPKLADKLVGTSVGGDPEDITYNFTLSELLNLFIPNIPGNTLQGVLDFGNTATQDINLTGIITTTTLNVGSTANILNSNLTGQTHITGGLYDRLNSIGTAGQVLTSTGTQVEWYTIPTVIPDLQQVLAAGNTAVNNIILTGNLSANNAALLTSTISTSLTVLGTLRDGLSSVGTNNQVLSSNVTGVRWVNLPVYSATSPLLYNSGTGVFSIQQANASQNGYLSSADWITFDGKQTAISLTTTGNSGASTLVGATINVPNYTLSGLGGVPQTRTLTINGVTFNLSADRTWTLATGVSSVSATTPLFSTGGANPDISIQQSSSSLNGYLSSTDWLTFNSKQPAGNYITSLTGEATGVGPGAAAVILSNAAVIGKLLTGLSITGSAITSSDSILTAFGKVQNQINGLIGGVQFQGVWNAATNTPALVSSVGTQGYYYIVDVAGNTNLNGITDWQVGDWAIFNGSTWNKVDNTDLVTSVNGQVGAVSLTTDNIPEGATNLYYLDSRARAALSFAAGSGAYNSTTGVITIPTDNSQILNGAGYITLVSLSATSPLSYNNTTGAFAIQVANTTQDGYLSSTDWNTFNGKQPFLGGTGLVKSVAGVISYITDNSANWNTAYNDSIVSAAVTGTATKTLTLNQQDGGTITASWSDIDTGLTSVGVSMPSAFTVTNSPLTSNGTIAITGSGNTLQYVDGTGALQSFPSLTGYVPYTGATANVNLGIYNLTAASLIKNGGISGQFLKADGSVDSSAYIVLGSLSATAPLSYNNTTGVFTISQSGASTNGYLSSTDWNTFNNKQATITLTTTGSSGASTLIGNTLNIPNYANLVTSVFGRIGAVVATEGDYSLTQLSDVTITTPSSGQVLKYNGTAWVNDIDTDTGITSLNGLTALTQTFAVGTSGTDFAISSVTSTHTFNLPTASVSNRGALSSADWTTFNSKEPAITAGTTLQYYRGDKTFQTLNTTVVPEGTNLYYLDSRARAAVSLTTTGSSGASTYNNTTGVFNIPDYGSALTGYVTLGTVQTITATKTFSAGLNTTAIGITGSGTSTGYIGFTTNTTTNIPIGTAIAPNGINALMFSFDQTSSNFKQFKFDASSLTNNTIRTYLMPDADGTLALVGGSGVGTVTSVSFTLGSSGTNLNSVVTNSTTTPSITLNVPTASAANRGALSAADWSTFNTKVGGVTATTPLFSSGGSTPNLTIQQSSGSQDGYLSSTDWTTFNNKQAAGNYITSLTGEATATGPGAAAVTLDNAAVTAKILTGVNITGGTILSTDSILTGFGKLQNQVNGLIGGSIYQGTWNANTNTPTLTSSVGTAGYYYIVSVAGNTNLNGITDWQVGDWAIFNGGVWQKVDNTDSVTSVNGQTGAVSLTTDNISEGVTNLYFTNTRARAALSFVAGSGAYNSSTGAITIPTNTSQLTNGANFITLASLSGTAPITYNSGTGAISITQAATASNGYLSSTDWNTFNNKQATISLTTTGTSGAATLVGATLNIPQYQSVITNPVTGTGTANEITYWTGTSTVGSLSTATYPSLTELSYVKGVTSSIQTQLNSLAPNNASFGDANAPTTGGFFTAYNPSNIPAGQSGGDWGLLNAPMWTSNSAGERYTFQFASNLDNNANIFVRKFRYFGSVLQSTWYTLLNSGNYSAYALPLSGGTLTGQLNVTYSIARVIIGDGTNSMSLGLWDTVNNRIETTGRPLYMVSYGGTISIGRSGGDNLVVDTGSVTFGNVNFTSGGNVNAIGANISGVSSLAGVVKHIGYPYKVYQNLCAIENYYGAAGAIAITTNIPFSAGNMLTIKVKGYDYNSANVFELTFATYAGEGSFFSPCYTSNSNVFTNTYTWYKNSSNNVVLVLGSTAGNYQYQVYVSEFKQGYNTLTSSYADGWTISAITSTTGLTNGTTIPNKTYTGGIFVGSYQGSAIADAYISSASVWNAKQNAITLTTTGTSGAATLVGSTLNIPDYGGSLSGYLPLTGGTLTGLLTSTISSGNNIYLIKGTGPSIRFDKTNATAQSWEISTDPSFRIYNGTLANNALTIAYNTNAATFTGTATYGISIVNTTAADSLINFSNTANGYSFGFSSTGTAGQRFTFINGAPTEVGYITAAGSAVFSSFVKTGGTSSQFLKADGSVDSSTYLTTSSAASTYVPYTGATANVDLGGFNITAGGTSSFVAATLTSNLWLKNTGTYDFIISNNTSSTTNVVRAYYTTNDELRFYAKNTAGASVVPKIMVGDGTTFTQLQSTITLTTTGTSGAATFTSNTLNIPNYGSALSGYLPLTGGTLTGALGGTSASFSTTISSGGTISSGDSITMGGELYYGGITSNRKLRAYSSGSEGSATLNYSFWTGSAWSIVSTLTSGGAANFIGSITAYNFSGSSSGTNTGDQTLSGLGGAPNNATLTDANTLTTGGFFTGYNATNVPSGLSSLDMGLCNMPIWGGNNASERYTMQLFANLDTNSNFYIRKFKYFGAVNLSTWYILLHSGNYSSYALPLSGGTLTGQLNLTYAGARTIIGDGTNSIVIGLWDGVNCRFETSGRPLYMVSYGGKISIGRSGYSALDVDTTTTSFGSSSMSATGVFTGTGLDISDNSLLNKVKYTQSSYRVYRNLARFDNYGNGTGAIAVYTNIPWTAANMLTIQLKGYRYGDRPFDITVACYAGEGNFYSPGYFTNSANAIFGTYTWYKDANNKVVVVLGNTAGSYGVQIWAAEYKQGFGGQDPTYADGWSIGKITTTTGLSNAVAIPEKTYTGGVFNGESVTASIITASGTGSGVFNSQIKAVNTGSGAALIEFSNTANGFCFGFASSGGQRFVWQNGAPTEIMSLNGSGTLTCAEDVIAYGSPSDLRLKIIKEKIPNALDSILKLNGYKFDWKKKDGLLNIKEDIGVIAQEVAELFPELARTNADGNMSVRYQGLTAVLIEAVKEQQKQIDELKNRN